MLKSVLYFFLAMVMINQTHAQDTLPRFSVRTVGSNRTIVGWVNAYPVVKQISIQRSSDSLLAFKSILTVADPTSVQNGYVDATAPAGPVFYRLYILLENGHYLFSETKRPVADTTFKRTVQNQLTVRLNPADSNSKQVVIPGRINPSDNIALLNTMTGKLNPADSIAAPSLGPRPDAFLPSQHVFTNTDGNISVKLPATEKLKDYSIRFYDDQNNFLFELTDMKSRKFRLEKSVFLHAGWFSFELFDSGKLVEKYKFYLPKDY